MASTGRRAQAVFLMFEARKRVATLLERVPFRVSRLSEFCSVSELSKQTGHLPAQWPLVILKELTDNALDAAEEAGIPPAIEIELSTDTGEIVFADNGPGLPAETIHGVIDYTVRVSSREAYVSPSRGQQGNALPCIVAMPLTLDGTHGITIIESRGQAYRIVFQMDRVHREPRIQPPEVVPSDVQIGTRITVHWPRRACDLLEAAKDRFVQLAGAFTTFNPHLTLRCRWNGRQVINVLATNPGWRKWRPRDFTSAYWYSPATFERYMAAHVARDQEQGRTGRYVRDFIKDLRGLRRPDAQKLVLAETRSSRTPLDVFFAGGSAAITRLLDACKRHTEPVKPKALGLIGADHLLEDCAKLGGAENSFEYRKHLDTTRDGLPYAIEAAFTYSPERDAADLRRQIIAGVNFSIAINNPFNKLGYFDDLSSALAWQHIEYDDPVIVVLHYTCPRVDFSDHGKTAVTLPSEAGREAAKPIAAVTEVWAKQKRAELRSEARRQRRSEALAKEQKRRGNPDPEAPSGVLGYKIASAADECGVSIDSLAVLSREADPYTAWRRRREAEWFSDVFHRLVPSGTKHLRGLFYLLVSSPDLAGPDGKPFVNDYKHWQALQKASKAVRWLGLVPFERIIDERNAPPEVYVPDAILIETGINPGDRCDIPAIAEDAMPSFSLTGFKGRQTHRIIFYGEKSLLSVVLRPIAERIGAEMLLVTGESSDTHIAGMAKRASEDGRPAAVLYFSDFDPSGHQMPVSVARKLQALRDLYYPNLNVKLYAVALTIEQVRALGLPSSPFKNTEKRAAKWREVMGHEQTEIDAMVELHPDVLRDAVYDAIRPFYDFGLDKRVLEAEARWRAEANAALEAHPDYQNVTERIEAAWEHTNAAVDELHSEQERAAEILEDSVPPAPEIPDAAPDGEVKPALFDSTAGFVAATRQLIRHKKLIGLNDNDDEEDAQ
jgi:hypothetical protein